MSESETVENNNKIDIVKKRGRPRKIREPKLKNHRGRPKKYTNDEERLRAIRKSKLMYKRRNIDKIREQNRLHKRNIKNNKIIVEQKIPHIQDN